MKKLIEELVNPTTGDVTKTYADGSQEVFDGKGKLKSSTDANGQAVETK